MKTEKILIILFSSLSIICLWIHELDAFRKKEWLMFSFLRKLKEKTQYQIFLIAHIPLFLLTIYYVWAVFNSESYPLWIIWNVLMIIHSLVHFYAKKWNSNVFKSSFSFIFIYGAGITAIGNLLLIQYY